MPSEPNPATLDSLHEHREYAIYNKRRQSIDLVTSWMMASSSAAASHYGQLHLPRDFNSVRAGTYNAQLRATSLHLQPQSPGSSSQQKVIVLDLAEQGWGFAQRYEPADSLRPSWSAFNIAPSQTSLPREPFTKPSFPGALHLLDTTNLDHRASLPVSPVSPASATRDPAGRRKLADRLRGKRKSISTATALYEGVSGTSTPAQPVSPSLVLLAPDEAACEAWVAAINEAFRKASLSPTTTALRQLTIKEEPAVGMQPSSSLPVNLSALGALPSRRLPSALRSKPITTTGTNAGLSDGFNDGRRPSFLDRPPPSPRSYTHPSWHAGPPVPPKAGDDHATLASSSQASNVGASTSTLPAAEARSPPSLERTSSTASVKQPELRGRRSFTFGGSNRASSDPPPGANSRTMEKSRSSSDGRGFFSGLLGKKHRKESQPNLAQQLAPLSTATGSFEIVKRSQWDLAAAAGPARTAPNGSPYSRQSTDQSSSGHSHDTDSLLDGSCETMASSLIRERAPTPTLVEMGVGLEAAWLPGSEEEGGRTPRSYTDHFAQLIQRPPIPGGLHTIHSVDQGLDEQCGDSATTPTRRSSHKSSSSRRSASTGRSSPRVGQTPPARRSTLGDEEKDHIRAAMEASKEDSPRLYERRGVLGGRRAVSIAISKNTKSHSTPPSGTNVPFAFSPTASLGTSQRHTHQPSPLHLLPTPSSASSSAPVSPRPASMSPSPRSAVVPGVIEHIVAPVQLIEQMRQEQVALARARSIERARRGGGGLSPPPVQRSHSAGAGRQTLSNMMMGISPSPSLASVLSAQVPASQPMRKAASAPLQQPLGPGAPRRGSFGVMVCDPAASERAGVDEHKPSLALLEENEAKWEGEARRTAVC